LNSAGNSSSDTVLAEYVHTTGGGNAVKGTNGSSSSTSAGVFGYHTGSGYAVRGEANSGYGGYFTSSSSYGVYATGTLGVEGISSSSSGAGVVGYDSNGGIGVKGFCAGSGCWAGYFTEDVYINGTTYPPSDERFKKNIKDIDGAIDQLLKLRPRNFEWKEPEKHNGLTGTQIGFIAQEVEKVFPEWVRTDPDGYKALSVAQIEGLEVESIRTLKNRLDKVEADNAELRKLVYSMNPNRAGFAFGAGGPWGIAGIAVGVAFMAVRRKKEEKS
jgi:hypothetical protein